MSHMERAESAKRLDENLLRAIARCNEIAVALKQPLFIKWAHSLEGIRQQCNFIANAKGRTKAELESDINIFYGKLAAKQESLH